MTVLPYFLMLIVIAFFRVVLGPATTFFGIAINFPALLVLSVAISRTELTVLWFGFWAALVATAITPDFMGWQILATCGLAAAAFHARERLNLDSLVAKLSVLFVGIFLHNVMTALIEQPEGFLYQLWRTAFPGAVYTAFLAWLYFYIRRELFGLRRVRSGN